MTITIKCSMCGTELTVERSPRNWRDYADLTVQVGPCETCLADAKTQAEQGGYDRGREDGRIEAGND